jgi:hypothetical protein
MYKKQVKIKGKKYNYYYHNFKVSGRVKNICLGHSKSEATKKLEELMNKDIKEHLVNKELYNINFKNFSRTLIIVAVFGIFAGLFYFFSPGITGLAVYDNNLTNITELIGKLRIKEILAALISLELIFFGYNIYRDYKHKIKVI